MGELRQIAALFVEDGGGYYGLPGIDPWGVARDARLYPGPHPVIAHPPCARWCRLSGFVEWRTGGRLRRGEDGGCFASALASVRRWGGVLEHPAYSSAWEAFCLPYPPNRGGWVQTLFGEWVCQVEQGTYGHAARKPTWLFGVGIRPESLKWAYTDRTEAKAIVGRLRWKNTRCGRRPSTPRNVVSDGTRIGDSKAASATPPEFREALIALARGVANETRRIA